MRYQLIITAAGNDNDSYLNAGFELPKNLVPFKGTTILSYALSHYPSEIFQTTVILSKKECDLFNTDKIIASSNPQVKVLVLANPTQGGLCTALMGLNLESQAPLVIASGDSYFEGDILTHLEAFQNHQALAGTIVFNSTSPRWSYVRGLNETDTAQEIFAITEIQEKTPISPFATSGLFYFQTAQTFFQGASWALLTKNNNKGDYYLSHSLPYLLSNSSHIYASPLKSKERYVHLGRPVDLYQEVTNYFPDANLTDFKIDHLSSMHLGWFIGNFSPSLYKNPYLEASVKYFKKDDTEAAHYQKISTEITVIISGQARVNEMILNPGDMLTIPPNLIADFQALTDLSLVALKFPSLPDDKILA